MRRVGLIAVVLALTAVSSASAHTTITCDPCRYPFQQWIDQAKVPTPDTTIWVTVGETALGECDGDGEGCIAGFQRIFLEPNERLALHRVLLHEIGHAFDHYVLTDWGRLRFREISAHVSMPWWGGMGLAELFAETYKQCAWPLGARNEAHVAGLNKAVYFNQACHLIRRQGAGQ